DWSSDVCSSDLPMRFGDGEVEQLAAALRSSRSRLQRSALSAALSEHARALAQREQQHRLAGEVDGRLVELPYVFADHLGPDELEIGRASCRERVVSGVAR